MTKPITRTPFAALLPGLLALLLVSSCSTDNRKCGCAPPPKEPITAASLTRVNTWFLRDLTSAGQLYRDDAIPNRYSLQFRADGTYTQLSVGTWVLMGDDNSTLHLTDYANVAQEYKVEGATTTALVLSRPEQNNQLEISGFNPTR
jgi:hypothetical protein